MKHGTERAYYLAIDLGASSGRHVVGWREDGVLRTEEVYRFPNGVQTRDGHLVWDTEAILNHVQAGIAEAKTRFGHIRSLAIDTWGVDYVLLRGTEPVQPCYAYRDSRTEAVTERVHSLVSFETLYERTGCQFQPFNTVYQLFDDMTRGRLDGVKDFLMLPEYLTFRLTDVKVKEYTNATTTGLVNARTGEFDREIISRLGLPEGLFPKLTRPGAQVGEYDGVPVRLCASHDTASAVEGIPMEEDGLYISSGTWSLLGVKTPAPLTDERSRAGTWSNEGGVGYNRYQKNIMGLWLLNELRRELCPGREISELIAEAEQSDYDGLVDANSPAFLAPESMAAAFDAALPLKPRSTADYFRCACRSLAKCYADSVAKLERNTGKNYDTLYIVGGGAKNDFLNRLTAEETGKTVRALPIEATALGNLKLQMEAER